MIQKSQDLCLYIMKITLTKFNICRERVGVVNLAQPIEFDFEPHGS